MLINELIYQHEALSYCENPGQIIDNICTDIFKTNKSSLYIAQRSLSFDIEKLTRALRSGNCATVVCDKELRLDFPKERIIRVESPRRACALAYARYYNVDFKKMRFIGVTGTNGKSSTAFMIERILEEGGKSVGFIGTGKIRINGNEISDSFYSMTTPDPPLLYKSIRAMQDAGCEYIVMEVSSHALFFEKTAPICFDIGIFTNMSSEHSDFHKDMNEYFACKKKLFENSRVGLFNMDDEYSKMAYQSFKGEKYSVSIHGSAESMAKDIRLTELNRSEFIYRERGRIFKTELRLGGISNVYNSLMAIKCALILGIDEKKIKSALFSIDLIEGRNELISNHPKVIIDYAHTPVAIENELYFLKSQLLSGQKLIALFGCGGERDRKKRALMAAGAEKYADLIIISSDNSRSEMKTQIFKDILAGISDRSRVRVISSRKEAIIYAINIASKNDIVAVIGKGHERYNIDKNGKHRFDEREIITKELERLGQNDENKAITSADA